MKQHSFPNCLREYKLAPNKLRLEGRLQDEHSIQRDRLLLVTQPRPRQALQAAHQYMAEIESKANVQLDASMPLAWKLTQFWRQCYWRVVLSVNTYIIYQVDTSTSGRGHRLHYPWASVPRIGTWLKENSTSLQHLPFCLLTEEQESRMLPTVKALENSTRRSKSAFSMCYFTPLESLQLLQPLPEAPPAALIDWFFCPMPPFGTFHYSQALGRDIVKLIINIKTLQFWSPKPTRME